VRPAPDPKTARQPAPTRYDGGRLLVRLAPGRTVDSVAGALRGDGAATLTAISGTPFAAVTVAPGQQAGVAARLRRDPAVASVEPVAVRHAADIPNDLYWPDQTYLSNLHLPAAWSVTHGSSSVVIAVLDTGIDLSHPDLNGRLRAGWDFVQGDGTPGDDNGHGTFVAGVVAAQTNNGQGVAGVAWNASILPVKVLDATGSGDDADIAAGITWAADHDADVINLSLGGYGDSGVLRAAVDYALSKDVVVVAATGNDSTATPFYPAAYPGVIGVAATDAGGDLAWFSNHGDDVDLAAPGIGIVSTYPPSTYATWDGTSFAAPIVAGAAALVRAKNPAWTQAQIAADLQRTATDRGPDGHDTYYGYGLVDPFAALGGPVLDGPVPTRDLLEPNDTAGRATPLVGTSAATMSPQGDADWFAATAPGPGSFTFTVTPPAVGAELRADELDPALEAFGPTLHTLGTQDEHGAGTAETLIAAVDAAGPVYLRVANFAASVSPGAYTVTAAYSTTAAPVLGNAALFETDSFPRAARVGDVTGDGRADAVLTTDDFGDSPFNSSVLVFAQQPDGTLAPPAVYGPTTTSLSSIDSGVAIGDVDGDGFNDVAVATVNGVDIFTQIDSVLVGPTVVPSGGAAGEVELADMNGDGRLDLVVANELSDSIVLTNGGDGSWSPAGILSPALGDLAVGDVNGDGRPDVVGCPGVASYYCNTADANVFAQQPDGSFTRTVYHGPSGGGRGVAVSDLNGDGRMDVAVVQSYGEVTTWTQAPDGTLTNRQILPSGIQPLSLAAADVDLDGRVDLVASHNGTPAIGLYRQSQTGSLGGEELAPALDPGSAAVKSLDVGDVNGDGLPDVAYANGDRGEGGLALVAQRPRGSHGAQAWVSMTTPADFATGISPSNNITVITARRLSAATVTGDTVKLVDAVTLASVPTTVTYNASLQKITIDPVGSMLRGGPYLVRLAGIQDDGGDTMATPVEFRFSISAPWYPFATAGALVSQQYRDFLGREADPGGLAYWSSLLTAGTVTPTDVIQHFVASAEFGALVAPMSRLYSAYFARFPDFDGLMYWVNLLRAGVPLTEVSDIFAASAEFQATYGDLSPDAFVDLVYHNVLGRPPDPAGRAYWINQLTSGTRSRGGVMLAFSESPEYVQLQAAAVLVTSVYTGMLRRAPDPSGFDYWVAYVKAGGSLTALIAGFLNSPEYAARFA
jgi:type VII secretion-associated serine protease mycosin